MKALSVKQPWAYLITHGHKDVENRTWPTKYTGRLLIHAGLSWDPRGVERAKQLGVKLPDKDKIDKGGIVGWVTVTGCVTSLKSPWFVGPYGFTLADAEPLPFIPLRGKLGLFNFDIPTGEGK